MKTNVWFWMAVVLIVGGLIVLLTPIGARSTPALYVLLPVGGVFAGMSLVSRLMSINETAAEEAYPPVTKGNKTAGNPTAAH